MNPAEITVALVGIIAAYVVYRWVSELKAENRSLSLDLRSLTKSLRATREEADAEAAKVRGMCSALNLGRPCSWCHGPSCYTCDRTLVGIPAFNGRYCSEKCSEDHRTGARRVPRSFADFVAGDEDENGWRMHTESDQ